MNLQDAVDLLKKSGLEARIMGDGLAGGKSTAGNEDLENRTSLWPLFGIYQEGQKWVVNMSGVGQLPLVIKQSYQFESVVEAVCNFFKLDAQCSDKSISIQRAIWTLQKSGFIAEIDTDTDIRVRCSDETSIENTYYFMVNIDETQFNNRVYDYVLHWVSERNQWMILSAGIDKLVATQEVSSLLEAVTLFQQGRQSSSRD